MYQERYTLLCPSLVFKHNAPHNTEVCLPFQAKKIVKSLGHVLGTCDASNISAAEMSKQLFCVILTATKKEGWNAESNTIWQKNVGIWWKRSNFYILIRQNTLVALMENNEVCWKKEGGGWVGKTLLVATEDFTHSRFVLSILVHFSPHKTHSRKRNSATLVFWCCTDCLPCQHKALGVLICPPI